MKRHSKVHTEAQRILREHKAFEDSVESLRLCVEISLRIGSSLEVTAIAMLLLPQTAAISHGRFTRSEVK